MAATINNFSFALQKPFGMFYLHTLFFTFLGIGFLHFFWLEIWIPTFQAIYFTNNFYGFFPVVANLNFLMLNYHTYFFEKVITFELVVNFLLKLGFIWSLVPPTFSSLNFF